MQEQFCQHCGAANAVGVIQCLVCHTHLGAVVDTTHLAPAPGVLLNQRYQIQAIVGQGGFATVYRAEDTVLRQTVALKVIPLKKLSPQDMIDATDTYNREIQFGTTLKHRMIPRLYDHFMDRDHWYIVVDFIDGVTLEEYMKGVPSGRLPLKEVLEIGLQMCEVLSYLHTLKPPVIFRDIKPDNIMRKANGQIALIDFGIARHYREGGQRDTQTLGSPGYAAPEQYGSKQTNERSDIYSLGATLRTLATGVNPLDTDAVPKDRGELARLPRKLASLLGHMLEHDPAQRLASIEEVRSFLEAVAREEGIRLAEITLSSSRVGAHLERPQPLMKWQRAVTPGTPPQPLTKWQQITIQAHSSQPLMKWQKAGAPVRHPRPALPSSPSDDSTQTLRTVVIVICLILVLFFWIFPDIVAFLFSHLSP